MACERAPASEATRERAQPNEWRAVTGSFAAVGLLWPFADASVGEALVLVLYVAVILPVVPLGWLLIKRRYGTKVAGPLWPLLFFMLLASGYAMATPPWQTPDEPSHMMYAELVRKAGPELPARVGAGQTTAADFTTYVETHLDVLASLRKVAWPPDAQAVIDSDDIPGPLELNHPPLYYRVAAALTAPLGGAPMLARLAVLRAFGVMVAGWIVWLCGCAGRLLWPNRHRLAETPMVAAAAVPTFAAFAGTVNSDVLVNLFGAAFLVVALRLVLKQSRRDWGWFITAVALVVLGVMTKRSFLPLIPVLGLAVILRRRWSARELLGVVVVVQLVAAVVLLTLPTRPAAWNGSREHARCEGGRIGERALCGVKAGGVSQPLVVDALASIDGEAVSVGFWARSDRPAKVTVYLGVTPTEQVTAGVGRWHFGRVVFVSPPGLREAKISLVADGPVRMDGVVLAEGRFSERAPVYGAGSAIYWDGRRVDNLLINGSAEDTVVAAPEWLSPQVRRTFDSVTDAVYSVAGGESVPGVWASTGRRLGETFGIFWGTTGWDQPPRHLPVPLLWLLALIVGVALLGAGLGGTTLGRQVWPGRAAAVMIAVVVIGMLAVVVRGIPPIDREVISGRYLFPGIVAISLVLAGGWRWILSNDDRRFRVVTRWFLLATHVAFVTCVFIPYRWS